MRDYTTKGPKKVIQINEKELQQHLSTLVTDTVQEVLNEVLNAEADEMVGAARYEGSAGRQDYRSGRIVLGIFRRFDSNRFIIIFTSKRSTSGDYP